MVSNKGNNSPEYHREFEYTWAPISPPASVANNSTAPDSSFCSQASDEFEIIVDSASAQDNKSPRYVPDVTMDYDPMLMEDDQALGPSVKIHAVSTI